jgi:sRNA-binding protein
MNNNQISELETLGKRRRAKIVQAALASHFPNTFFVRPQTKLPLKIGIREDILAEWPEIDAGLLDTALRDYTAGTRYWDVLIAGADRIDLNGNPSGIVTPEAQRRAVYLATWKPLGRCTRSDPPSSKSA